jgi:hypothetical protein
MVIVKKMSSGELSIEGLPIILERHITVGRGEQHVGAGKKYTLISQYGTRFGGMPAVLRTASGDKQVTVTVRVSYKGHSLPPDVGDVAGSDVGVSNTERDALINSL